MPEGMPRMMNYLLIVAAILATVSCVSTKHISKWDVPGTGPIVCNHAQFEVCGLKLTNCGDGGDLTLNCVKEATYLGPGEYFEPIIKDEPAVPADYGAQPDDK